jgi:hypothetical protein
LIGAEMEIRRRKTEEISEKLPRDPSLHAML